MKAIIPAPLAAYLARVGAVQKNPRRWEIEDEDAPRYNDTRPMRASIKITGEGKLVVSKKEYAPPSDELKLIEASIASVVWPKSIGATEVGFKDFVRARRAKLGREPVLFPCWDEARKHVLFVHEMMSKPDGGKYYLPWVLMSTGEWEMAEPDDGLPLYGLEHVDTGRRIMVHEGAKTAQGVIDMLADPVLRAACPVADELEHYEHVAWIGGANAWHKALLNPLKRLPPDRVIVFVADNDEPGVEAVHNISRRLGRGMGVILFDDSFPGSFDLKDPWPTHPEWWRGKRYVGPMIETMISPGTWATEVVPRAPGEEGAPSWRVRKDFAREWLWSVEPNVFVHRRHRDRLLTRAVFNDAVRPFSNVVDTAGRLTQKGGTQVASVTYQPYDFADRHRNLVIRDAAGRRVVNTYIPPAIEPDFDGDPGFFVEYMEHVYPEERDRLELTRWCATLVRRPKVKMRYGVLLISETQGVGKTTLGESILKPLVGPHNTSTPNQQQIESEFNTWESHKRLAVINEIYSSENKEMYRRLLSVVADPTVSIRRMYLLPYEIKNYCTVFACSNSTRALSLPSVDRRWLVPRVTEDKWPEAKWMNFYARLASGGLQIIAGYFEKFLATNAPVIEGAEAPGSSRKLEIIAENFTDGFVIARDVAQQAIEYANKHKGQKILLLAEEVRAFVADKRGLDMKDRRLEKLSDVRAAMRAGGLMEPERQKDHRARRFNVRLDERKPEHTLCYALANFRIEVGTEWPEIGLTRRSPKDVVTF